MTALASSKPPLAPAAPGPPESRGVPRDGVRLMVATRDDGAVRHTVFSRVGEFLRPGDLLVVNVSSTVPASLDGLTYGDERIRLHLSSSMGGKLWTVEPRHPLGVGSERIVDFPGGEVRLPGGAGAVLLTPDSRSPRLWVTELRGVDDLGRYLRHHGQPIRYSHTARAWPLAEYQTVYARRPGSAEMPSAGRPFTADLITSLVAAGISVAPVTLHAGVASFENGERPDIERYDVPEATAALVNHAKAVGGRVVAVGTTTVRALETVADSRGLAHPGKGTTDLVVERDRSVRVVDGLITGWHDDGASHLDLVAAVAGPDLIDRCYREAKNHGYLWHEFGDSLLVLRRSRLHTTSAGSGNQRRASADSGSGSASSQPSGADARTWRASTR